MKLDLQSGPLKDKQTLVVIGLIAVIVIAGGWVVYSNFFAGSGGGEAIAPAPMTPPPGMAGPGATPAPGPAGVAPQPGPPPMPDAAAPQPNPAPGPAGVAPQPGAAPGPAGPPPGPGAQPAGATAPAPPPAAPPAVAHANPGGKKTVTVFGSITATLPSKWGIGLASSGSAGVFTDGKARFEIHAPNPKAASAKAIADSALASFAKGGKVVAQGPVRISGFDSYAYTATTSGGQMKIIGIDAPTRVAIVEYVKGGNMAAYRATFDKMESDLRFR